MPPPFFPRALWFYFFLFLLFFIIISSLFFFCFYHKRKQRLFAFINFINDHSLTTCSKTFQYLVVHLNSNAIL